MNLLLIIGHMRSNKVLGWYKRIKKRMQTGIHITSPYHVLAKAIENLVQVIKPVQTSRTGCKANLNAKLIEAKWYVTSICTNHNHDLSPSKARYFKSHKNLDSHVKRKLLINDRAGITMSKSFNSLAVEAGGYEHLQFG